MYVGELLALSYDPVRRSDLPPISFERVAVGTAIGHDPDEIRIHTSRLRFVLKDLEGLIRRDRRCARRSDAVSASNISAIVMMRVWIGISSPLSCRGYPVPSSFSWWLEAYVAICARSSGHGISARNRSRCG